jgi:ATP-dependent Clp protease ATP-binding subunit ClpX
MFVSSVNSGRADANKMTSAQGSQLRSQIVAWLATVILSASVEMNALSRDAFHRKLYERLWVTALAGIAGYYLKDLVNFSPLRMLGVVAAVKNCWDAFTENGFGFESNGFVAGIFARDVYEQLQIRKMQERLSVPEPTEKAKTIYSVLQNQLNRKVIGQTEASRQLMEAIASHYQRLRFPMNPSVDKGNILLVGPSGSGKTLMMQSIGETLGVPIAFIDGSRLVPEGLVGPKFEDAYRQLYEKAGQNINQASMGIIFIDEIDKLFKDADVKANQFRGVQNQLLTGLQGAEIRFKTSDAFFAETKTIHTNNILFVMAGAFGELTRKQRRLKASFSEQSLDKQDLLNYGLNPEFVGRLGHIIQLRTLSRDDYRAILMNPYSKVSFHAWQEEFAKNQLKLEYDSGLADFIVDYCEFSQTGVRDLDYALRQLMTPILIESIEKIGSGQLAKGSTIRVTTDDWFTRGLGKKQLEERLPTLSELKALLDSQVVGQQDAKNVLAEAIYFHFCLSKEKQVNPAAMLAKGNVLLVGPSGTGKTLMMQVLSEKLGIPMAMLDVSRLTREGIVGAKPGDAILALLHQTRGDVGRAEKGIIFLDEVDKMFEDTRQTGAADVSGRTIQNQLLSMLQGDDITVTYNNEVKTVNTKDILFVMAGAFSHLTTSVRRPTINDQVLLQSGMKPEFLGRIGYIAQLYSLTPEEVRKTLTHGSRAPLTAWSYLFKQYGAVLTLTEATLKRLIADAAKKATGIRGFHFELRKLLSPLLAGVIEQREKEKGKTVPIEIKRVEV